MNKFTMKNRKKLQNKDQNTLNGDIKVYLMKVNQKFK